MLRLEQALFDAPTEEFPQTPASYAENKKPFPERYNQLKTELGEKHDNVEIGALLSSIKESGSYNSLVYLNQHGKGHVEIVIRRAWSLIDKINPPHQLSGFEIFLLLCAIQIHDIGNVNGRKSHTISFKNEFFEIARKCNLTEPGIKDQIFQIACVHGGIINGQKDTVAQLRNKIELCTCKVRPQLIASILRFADELADDYTRAKEIKDMPAESQIYHAYSKALHTVDINKDEGGGFISMAFFLEKEEAEKEYKVNGKTMTLLEEILNRTEKMERERRYCHRFFIPYLLITKIKVVIDILFPNEFSARTFEYTLQESGYPDATITIKERDDIMKTVIGRGV
ncbi:MAG: hypothetical protein GX625_06375 [Clostridiaceae bacterium]|nr:hypothetical protein [Clostridiaceae bacterium]